MAFQKGQSGNPGGRPKVAEAVRKLAQDHGQEAIERLVALMRGEDARVAQAAAGALLDRGFGKPAQTIDLDASVRADINWPLPKPKVEG